jgi:hypothetical protein
MIEWAAFFSAILGAATALGGVALTQTAERRKAQEDRIWKERAVVNIDLLDWAAAVVGSPRANGIPPEPAHLEARVQAFASERTAVTFKRFQMSLSPYFQDDMGMDPNGYATMLRDSVRRDLQPPPSRRSIGTVIGGLVRPAWSRLRRLWRRA